MLYDNLVNKWMVGPQETFWAELNGLEMLNVNWIKNWIVNRLKF